MLIEPSFTLNFMSRDGHSVESNPTIEIIENVHAYSDYEQQKADVLGLLLAQETQRSQDIAKLSGVVGEIEHTLKKTKKPRIVSWILN